MLYSPADIKAMKAALIAAERSLYFAYPYGVDQATRETLAKAILQAMADGVDNPLSLSANALSKLAPKSAAHAA